MTISIEKAELIALVIECCFFGIFSALFFATLWVLFNKSPTGKISLPLVLTTCSMYGLAITHLSIDVYRVINAFVNYADRPNGPAIFYAKLDDPSEVAKTAVYSVQAILTDCFFVWRCYIVWNKRWSIIVLPVTLVIGTTIAASGVCWEFAKALPENMVFEPILGRWITSAFSLTLATNVICTFLIAFRIWRSQRLLKHSRYHSDLFPVMIIVIESGAIYSSALIAMIITYALGSNSQYITVDLLTSLIGIVFTLIIVRVGLGISSNGTTPPQLPRAVKYPTFSAGHGHQRTSGQYLKPMTLSASPDISTYSDVEHGQH